VRFHDIPTPHSTHKAQIRLCLQHLVQARQPNRRTSLYQLADPRTRNTPKDLLGAITPHAPILSFRDGASRCRLSRRETRLSIQRQVFHAIRFVCRGLEHPLRVDQTIRNIMSTNHRSKMDNHGWYDVSLLISLSDIALLRTVQLIHYRRKFWALLGRRPVHVPRSRSRRRHDRLIIVPIRRKIRCQVQCLGIRDEIINPVHQPSQTLTSEPLPTFSDYKSSKTSWCSY
jgi:hypothetical protein